MLGPLPHHLTLLTKGCSAALLQCLIERGGYTLLDVRPELELDVVRCRPLPLPFRVSSLCRCRIGWRRRRCAVPLGPSPAARAATGAASEEIPGRVLHPPAACPVAHGSTLQGLCFCGVPSPPAGGPRARLHQRAAAALALGVQPGEPQQGGGAPAKQGLPGGGGCLFFFLSGARCAPPACSPSSPAHSENRDFF